MPSIDLQSCEPKLREAFLRGKRNAEQEYPGLIVRVTCTHRSVQEQQLLWAIGRTLRDGQWVVVDSHRIVTKVDGVKELSRHNHFPSQAIDFCITWGGKVSWRDKDYTMVGPYFEMEGLRWGGNFDSNPDIVDRWLDLPHIELRRDA